MRSIQRTCPTSNRTLGERGSTSIKNVFLSKYKLETKPIYRNGTSNKNTHIQFVKYLYFVATFHIENVLFNTKQQPLVFTYVYYGMHHTNMACTISTTFKKVLLLCTGPIEHIIYCDIFNHLWHRQILLDRTNIKLTFFKWNLMSLKILRVSQIHNGTRN